MVRTLAFYLFLFFALFSCEKKINPPNIIIFFIDDLGWTDLGCYGSDLYETPNIDKLAQQGILFTQAYAACTVCSPSRAALMTGKYPARLHLTDWIEGHKRPLAKLQVPDWTMYLDTAQITLPELLRKAGYATANIGKWHLGNEEVYWPLNQGFDVNIGGYRWGAPGSYFYPYHGGKRDKMHPPGLEEGEVNEFLTQRLTDEAVRFIEQNKERPFFLYLPHYTVHTPLQAPDSVVAYYKQKVTENLKHKNPVYAAMVHTMDQSIGQIMNKIELLNIGDNTVIFFTSDNGGLILREITDNAPLRAGKGSSYEGGIRVPLIVHLPGMMNQKGICTEPVITMDLFPTVLSLAGLKPTFNDGMDISSLLNDPKTRLQRKSLYWHYPHYHNGGATPYSVIRKDDYKLIEFFEDGRLELYNLAEDIAERSEVSGKYPNKVEELYLELSDWRLSVNAQMSEPNPDYSKAGSEHRRSN